MFRLWHEGLRNTMWATVAEQLQRDPFRRRRWTKLEAIYAMERIMVVYGGEPTLNEATFILKNEGNPTPPDFRVWSGIGPLFVYAHDKLSDHLDWLTADARGHFIWHAVYLDVLPPQVEIQFPGTRDRGMQILEEPAEEANAVAANDEEEEEEEDPEEDPEWEEVPRTPTPPAVEEEAANPIPALAFWGFNQPLDIPDSGRREPEVDPTLWRDIYDVREQPPQAREAIQELVPEPVPEPMEVENDVNAVHREARERVARLREEVQRELEVERTNALGQRVEENEEREEADEEPLVRPTRRRRMTVRTYLRQFVRRNDGSSSSRRPPSSATPDDSE